MKKKLLYGIAVWQNVLIYFFLTCFFAVSPTAAAGNQHFKFDVQDYTLNLSFTNERLENVLDEISKQSGIKIVYSNEQISEDSKVSVDMTTKNIEEALRAVLGNEYSYKRINDYIAISTVRNNNDTPKTTVATVQNQDNRTYTVTGVITEGDGNPLIGASIIEKGTINGVVTDVNGRYSIKVPPGATLQYHYIGYNTEEREIKSSGIINIRMFEAAVSMEGIVTIAYGSQKKESVIGAISTLSSDELKLPTGKISTNLAGQLAGVVGVSRSGEPGEAGQFYIRGISSFNSASQGVLVLVDGVERSLDSVDPEDIASFSILKDATATAVYGVRGANGVMLITTRRGSEGKPRITFRGEAGLITPNKYTNMVNSYEFADMVNEIRPGFYTEYDLQKYRSATPFERNLYPDVNWRKELFRKYASNQRANVTISGGGNIARYFVSGSFYNEGSIYKNSSDYDYNTSINYKRYSFRANVDLSVTKSTTLNINLSNLYEVKNEPAGSSNDSNSRGRIWDLAYRTAPNAYPAYYTKEDGSFDRLAGQQSGQGWNPYNEVIHAGYREYFYNSAQSVITLTQDFSDFVTEGLKADVRFAWDAYNNTSIRRRKSPQTFLATGMNPDGTLEFIETNKGEESLGYSESGGGSRAIYLEASLTYNRVFNDLHRVGALFLYNHKEKTNLWAGSSINALPYKNQGIAGRLTYSYADRYFAEANFGYNGSENFSPGKRFGFFPSGAVGWMISNERFWLPLKEVVDAFKIRASYGTVGNDQIGGGRRFIYEGTILTDRPGYSFGNTGQSGTSSNSAYREGDIINDNVGWEKAYKFDLGVELSLFRSLKLQADYFNEKRTNIFVQRKGLPDIAGNTNVPWSNIGRMRNKGVDASLEYSKRIGDFSLSARGNFTYNYAKIIDNDEPDRKYPYLGAKGKKYNQPFGFVCLGFFKDQADIDNSPEQQLGAVRPGDLKYADINGDGVINDDDRVPIGYPELPQIVYGFGGSVSWKSLDLSFFFQGAGKTSIFVTGNTAYGFTVADIRANNMLKDMYDHRWQEGKDNSNARYPRLFDGTNDNNNRTSTLRMHKGNYLRLKNAEIGYSLPKHIAKKMYMEGARIYLSGMNLLTFSKFKLWDPEQGSSGTRYPINRVYNIGINLTF